MKKYDIKSREKGIALTSIILGLALIGAASAIAYKSYQDKQIVEQGRLAGEQIRLLGQAVDEYISINRDQIANLRSNDILKCQNNGVCDITVAGLRNTGELPSTFSDYNSFKSPYKIQIKREGNPPDYKITGIIVTSESPDTKPLKILGYAVKGGGANAGTNLADTSKISGNSGLWSYTKRDFDIISDSQYQLAYRVGYNASQYSPYLRRDGSLPMTGSLSMDRHSIRNVDYMDAQNLQVNNGLNVGGRSVIGNLHINGDTTMGGRLTGDVIPRQVVVAGQGCSPNGLIARDQTGLTLSCVNGAWTASNSGSEIYLLRVTTDTDSYNYFRDGVSISAKFNSGGSIIEAISSSTSSSPYRYIAGYDLKGKCIYSQLPSKQCACGYGKIGKIIASGAGFLIGCDTITPQDHDYNLKMCNSVQSSIHPNHTFRSRKKCLSIVSQLPNKPNAIVGIIPVVERKKESKNRWEGGGGHSESGPGGSNK